ncbi:ligase-associated DNA damage response endonuclease PdeM [Salegentibacter chungangensis]|uniref:Ligase-associated DNA damage response endonuclease PdeM n=1 Tax=Salegentibacter chungangensis TaxID=1335724 RepID=A0ABW3NN63_9FLAO
MNIELKGQNFEFHPSGAAYWIDQEMLLISDVHLGKISHFRKYGSAVPQEAIGQNFLQLEEAVKRFDPEMICFLGDLFHSAMNSEWQLFERWVGELDCQVFLVSGNHDVISPLKYEELGIEIYKEVRVGKFLLTHQPEDRDGSFNICGHIHPGYHLQGLGKQSLKLPCFYKTDHRLILPAFGEFTGNYIIKPEKGDEIYALTKKEVILVYS